MVGVTNRKASDTVSNSSFGTQNTGANVKDLNFFYVRGPKVMDASVYNFLTAHRHFSATARRELVKLTFLPVLSYSAAISQRRKVSKGAIVKSRILDIFGRIGMILVALAFVTLIISFISWSFFGPKGNRLSYYQYSWEYVETDGPPDGFKFTLDRSCALPYAQKQLDASSQALSHHLATRPNPEVASLEILKKMRQDAWIREREMLRKDVAGSEWLVRTIGSRTTFEEANEPEPDFTGRLRSVERYFLEKYNDGFYREPVSAEDLLGARLGLLRFEPLISEEIMSKCVVKSAMRKVDLPPLASTDIALYGDENEVLLGLVTLLAGIGLFLAFLLAPTLRVLSYGWSWLLRGR